MAEGDHLRLSSRLSRSQLSRAEAASENRCLSAQGLQQNFWSGKMRRSEKRWGSLYSSFPVQH